MLPPRTALDEVVSAIKALLDNIANGRLDAAVDAFAPDADTALYGSEAGEVVVGPTALRRFLAGLCHKAAPPSFTLRNCRVSSSQEVAWFVADAEVRIGADLIAPYRLSGILERRNGRWLWRLFNGSEPLPDRS